MSFSSLKTCNVSKIKAKPLYMEFRVFLQKRNVFWYLSFTKQANKQKPHDFSCSHISSIVALSFFFFFGSSKTAWDNCLYSPPLSCLLVTLYPFQSCPWIHYSTELLSPWLSTISMMQNAEALPLTSLTWPLSRVQHILLTFPLSFWLILSILFATSFIGLRNVDRLPGSVWSSLLCLLFT